MERHLADRDYFVGSRYSLADISLYAYTHVADEGGFEMQPLSRDQSLARPRRRAAGAREDRRLDPSPSPADPLCPLRTPKAAYTCGTFVRGSVRVAAGLVTAFVCSTVSRPGRSRARRASWGAGSAHAELRRTRQRPSGDRACLLRASDRRDQAIRRGRPESHARGQGP